MRGAIPTLSQYASMLWYSVKEQERLYLYLLLEYGSKFISMAFENEC
jgi:hypothetical protein